MCTGEEPLLRIEFQLTLNIRHEPLEPGTGLSLAKVLLQLNEHTPENEPPITEVVILSQNSLETSVCVLNSVRERDLDTSRFASPA